MTGRHGRGQVLPAVFPVERVRMSGERAPECHERKKALHVVQRGGRCVVCCVIVAALWFVEPRAMPHPLLRAGPQQVSRRSHGVMVSTLDSESSDLSSNLSGTSTLTFTPIFQVLAFLPTLC